MYFSAKDKREMMSMIYNWPAQKILPVMLDVGTNNLKLIEDPLYLRLRQPRLEGEEYLSIIDEFIEAVLTSWPKAIVQFEDFQMKWAFETLKRYRERFCMFNDDVQELLELHLLDC
ncbi:hypothetical protein ERO13_D11G223014v2 [Gossypium hirsutum]|uniref:NAD-dependent malic enzyme 59 kDa isoform, mitochondrial n=1 Tax=Gossypium hirsutum TaxID=3635 RepID=A0A1U8KAZ4_GOSHI|nr:NAD-dependent malic enzyme 59 kDa isoform, mitochondrial-like [Gossypium hirsutum]KAG4121691.1 hypothetical protein ERO13_D11G223014v2 [Gossypium hirsutum]